MQSKSFYSGVSLRLEHVEERVLRFLAVLRDRVLSKRAAVPWRQFPTQQAAFDFADANDPGGETLRTFSVELSSSGKRKFLVTSYTELWRRYSAMVPHHRHYYEIIREGSPCHLYLDLEFKTEHNPERNGEAAVDATLRLLRAVLRDRLDLHMDDSWVLELDSSTESKFSRHIIIRVPGAAYADNSHVGAIVAEACAFIWDSRRTLASGQETTLLPDGDGSSGDAGVARVTAPLAGPALQANWWEDLIVKKADGGETLLIDAGVYTRNRAFRLHLSSKADGEASLVPTGRFGTKGLTAEQVFMVALVCNVPPEARLLRCAGAEHCTSGIAAAVTARQAMRMRREAQGTTAGTTTGTAVPSGPGVARYGPSEHPELDAFITSVCKEGGTQGQIRSWVELDGGAVRLYNIKGNRYCGNIGRQHRSNGIFIVVDLEQGMWYQKCYDPECRSYRSPVTPLPENLHRLCTAATYHEGGDSDGSPDEAPEALPQTGDVWGDEAAVSAWDDMAFAVLQHLEGV